MIVEMVYSAYVQLRLEGLGPQLSVTLFPAGGIL